MTLLTFIIPVRHQDNAKDWNGLVARLSQTIASIGAQEHDDWRAVIVANDGAQLPEMPPRFTVVRVSFPPNLLHNRETATRQMFLDAFRLDKGRRVLAGMLVNNDSEYFMIVDDDDFVSARITGFVKKNRGKNGWKINKGYVWNEGSNWLYRTGNLNGVCGTTLIIRSDLYALPASFENADEQMVMAMLGSHRGVPALLMDNQTPLEELPFAGAIYRIGNSGSHSQKTGLFNEYFFNKVIAKRPWLFLKNLSRLRWIGNFHKREFFGVSHI